MPKVTKCQIIHFAKVANNQVLTVEFLYSFFKKVTFLCIRSSQKGTASVTLQTKLTLSPVIWNTLDTSSTSSVIFHSFYGHKPDLDWEHAISRRDIGTAAVGPVGILLDINNALQNVAATSCETNMYCGPKKPTTVLLKCFVFYTGRQRQGGRVRQLRFARKNQLVSAVFFAPA